MRVTMLSGQSCPTCEAFTVAHANGKSEYCPACHTVVTRFRNVKLVQPNAMRGESAIR